MSDLLKQIASKREERVQDLHLDLPVPTWEGDLVVRFNVLPRKQVEKFATRKRSVEADTNFIISSTRELYLFDPNGTAPGERMEENTDYVRIEDDESGMPVRWDAVLAEKIGKSELQRAHDVLMYCVKDNALAIGWIAGRLITWMQNTDSNIAESLVGE